MPSIIYAKEDPASYNTALAIRGLLDFKEVEKIDGMLHWSHDRLEMLELGAGLFKGTHSPLLTANFLDNALSSDLVIFLSRHSSTNGTRAFTVHAEGNWSDKNELGGEPKQLSVAAPKAMLSVLIELSKQEPKDIGITYEATHHGPLLKTPSLFVELGGDEATIEDAGMAKILAAAVANSIQKDDYDYKKVALGIGGTHYPRKFTQSAIGGEYAFAHIMSKYYVHEIDMLDQAVERSNPRPEVAAIEWKSVNSSDRASIINKLNQMGLDYVRL